MSPTVSVIIPTYNRVGLLERAIESVLSQTYRDFEIIIVDDASSDNTQEMIGSKFQVELKRGIIRTLKNTQKKERSFSRNEGMAATKGRYIALLDDDDVWLPDHLRILVGYLDDHKDVGCVFSNYVMVKEDNSEEFGVKNLNSYRSFSYRELCILGILSLPSASMFTKEAYINIGAFKEDLIFGENREFFARIALNYPVHYIETVTSRQYIHGGSYSRISRAEYAKNRERIWKIIEKNSIECSYPLRRGVYLKAYLNLSWFFLPDISKSKEYFLKASKIYPECFFERRMYGLFFRIISGQKIYNVFRDVRKRRNTL